MSDITSYYLLSSGCHQVRAHFPYTQVAEFINPARKKKQPTILSKLLVHSMSRGCRQLHLQLFSAVPKCTSVPDWRQSSNPGRDPSLTVLSGLIVAVTAASI